MKRIAAVLGILLVALLAVLVTRAAALRSRQVEVAPLPERPVDTDALAARLGAALRIPTITHQERSQLDAGAFLAFHRYLEETWPSVHASLARETVAGYSLLYTWPGTRRDLAPVVLAAHVDVVPIDAGSRDAWTHPPFAGTIADGYVWGRGAMDDKATIVCLMQAVDALLASGFRPERTLHLAFGHDEEAGGEEGAQAIAALLEARGKQPELVLDEGGAVITGFVPGIEPGIAVIGVAEKGSVSIALEIEAPGGHSSVPPRQTAIGDLSRAIDRLERNPMPASIDGVTAHFFDALAPELPFAARLVLANLWLFGPLLEIGFASEPSLDAMLRTTTAATLVEAGVKENVLPTRARGVLNFRIHPADSVASVAEHVRRTIADERFELEVGLLSIPREPSPVSAVDSRAFAALQRTIREVIPGAVVVPYLVLGGTDARYYRPLTENVYRFGPFEFSRDSMHLAHGTDERISIANLATGVRFYARLIANVAGPE